MSGSKLLSVLSFVCRVETGYTEHLRGLSLQFGFPVFARVGGSGVGEGLGGGAGEERGGLPVVLESSLITDTCSEVSTEPSGAAGVPPGSGSSSESHRPGACRAVRGDRWPDVHGVTMVTEVHESSVT